MGGCSDFFIVLKDEEIERGDGRSGQRAGRKQSLPGEVTNTSIFYHADHFTGLI